MKQDLTTVNLVAKGVEELAIQAKTNKPEDQQDIWRTVAVLARCVQGLAEHLQAGEQ